MLVLWLDLFLSLRFLLLLWLHPPLLSLHFPLLLLLLLLLLCLHLLLLPHLHLLSRLLSLALLLSLSLMLHHLRKKQSFQAGSPLHLEPLS